MNDAFYRKCLVTKKDTIKLNKVAVQINIILKYFFIENFLNVL